MASLVERADAVRAALGLPTLKTCLRLEEHGGDDDFAWVLLDELTVASS